MSKECEFCGVNSRYKDICRTCRYRDWLPIPKGTFPEEVMTPEKRELYIKLAKEALRKDGIDV